MSNYNNQGMVVIVGLQICEGRSSVGEMITFPLIMKLSRVDRLFAVGKFGQVVSGLRRK